MPVPGGSREQIQFPVLQVSGKSWFPVLSTRSRIHSVRQKAGRRHVPDEWNVRWLPIVGGSVNLRNLVLPALTLGIVMAAKYARQVRAAVLEELNQDYVTGARARGMSESHILWKEVLPNAMLPLITLLGLSFGNLLGGAAVVEIVFSWPGLGYLAVQSIIYRDFQLVQGIVLWIALMYMIINLVIDISYNRLDPRLRKAGR